MQLLMQGYGVQPYDWHVTEKTPAGFCRVYYLTGGPVTYRDLSNVQTMTAGHLYIYPSSVPYSIRHDPEKPMACLWFHFDFFPAKLERAVELPIDEGLRGVLNALIIEAQSGRGAGRFYRHLAEALCSRIEESGLLDPQEPTLTKLLQAIRAGYREPTFSVENISRSLGYSTEHFIRLFRRFMHVTPYRYVSDLRLDDAARLLLDGERSVDEIGKMVGYSDGKVFARAFARKFGVSPSEYRRTCHPVA